MLPIVKNNAQKVQEFVDVRIFIFTKVTTAIYTTYPSKNKSPNYPLTDDVFSKDQKQTYKTNNPWQIP